MAIRMPAMANGANVLPMRTVRPMVRTRKKVPMNSVSSLAVMGGSGKL